MLLGKPQDWCLEGQALLVTRPSLDIWLQAELTKMPGTSGLDVKKPAPPCSGDEGFGYVSCDKLWQTPIVTKKCY